MPMTLSRIHPLREALEEFGLGKLDDERAAAVSRLRAEYDEDIDVVRLASELVVDDIVEPEDLRAALVRRVSVARTKDRSFSRRRHGVTPV